MFISLSVYIYRFVSISFSWVISGELLIDSYMFKWGNCLIISWRQVFRFNIEVRSFFSFNFWMGKHIAGLYGIFTFKTGADYCLLSLVAFSAVICTVGTAVDAGLVSDQATYFASLTYFYADRYLSRACLNCAYLCNILYSWLVLTCLSGVSLLFTIGEYAWLNFGRADPIFFGLNINCLTGGAYWFRVLLFDRKS